MWNFALKLAERPNCSISDRLHLTIQLADLQSRCGNKANGVNLVVTLLRNNVQAVGTIQEYYPFIELEEFFRVTDRENGLRDYALSAIKLRKKERWFDVIATSNLEEAIQELDKEQDPELRGRSAMQLVNFIDSIEYV